MTTHVRCGTLFAGDETATRSSATLGFGEDGTITFVCDTADAPPVCSRDTVLDYSDLFVMPGLLDVHTHLAYGNAKSEEDIDLYQPMEFRALRGLFFAQKVVAAGYTAICAPGDAGQISLSVRNAIDFGLFDGPRVTAAGRYLTTRQGLTDWYPTWIGVPETSIGRLVTNKDEAIEEIRVQVKNGVDCIKLAMDGVQTREDGSLVAAFNQVETLSMVDEAHRLGKRVVVHARGREAVLYSARAGVDLIFHATYLDEECIDAMLKSGGAIGPTMTFPRNIIDFTQPHEPAATKGRPSAVQREYQIACSEFAEGAQGRHSHDDRHRFRLRGNTVRRVARDGAGDLRPRPGFHARGGVALRDVGHGGFHGERWPDWRFRGRPPRRLYRGGRLAVGKYHDPAGQGPDPSCAYRRQTDANPRPQLRPATGHRPKSGQLDRSLHAGTGPCVVSLS